jgi:DNA-binding response OmpR family regulator
MEAVLDRSAGALRCGDFEIHLTQMETTLMALLADGHPKSHETLLAALYNGNEPDWAAEIVRVMACRIRRKLVDNDIGLRLNTVWGTGYRLNAPLPMLDPSTRHVDLAGLPRSALLRIQHDVSVLLARD